MQVESWSIDKLMPYAANARVHNPMQVSQIAESIREFGFNVPCLVDDAGELIAGHGRLLAAKQLGLDHVPVIRLSHMTPVQARAYRIADNKIALNSEWDLETLAAELERLATQDAVQLGTLGFTDEEIRLITDGWQTDLAVIEKHGSAIDAVPDQIVVTCRHDDRELVVAAIRAAIVMFEGCTVD